MRLKYKQTIFYITMGIMGIGMATFSFQVPEKTPAENIPVITSNNDSGNGNQQKTIPESATAIPTTISTPTPTPEPVNSLVDAPQEITELIVNYYTAKLTYDMDEFKNLLKDPSAVDLDKLSRKVEYIKDYKNIKCYTKKGTNEVAYIVYVVYDMELPIIETLSPSIDEHYITYVNNKPLICFQNSFESNKETIKYIEELRQNEDVTFLIENVQNHFKQALESDESLNEFFLKLISEDQSNVTPSAGPTAIPPANNSSSAPTPVLTPAS